MKNADLPAMPIKIDGLGQYGTEYLMGLTKREMIAMHIMANTCFNNTDRNQTQHYEYAAESAVSLADALLKELSK
ncbi:hypothetical protein [Pseudoalteromonas phage C7]|uniref:hypothetical protein n=1 Tax=Pseudoalteromonas phage C7 TaxID=2510494 RepID=UPI0010175A4B|nr:hypothetical protein PP587_gp46 [Pseudoalteromonas phage C7]QAY18000.1 hypothetical protein [Pseudoalteromonas phage C7]